MSNVVKFYPRGNPDRVLEACKGHFQDVLIIGYDKDGDIRAHSSEGIKALPEANYLVDQFKNAMLTGFFLVEDEEG